MIKRRIERIAVTLLSVALLLSSTGIASSLAVNELGGSGSTTVLSDSTEKSSTTISQEGGTISTTTVTTEGGKLTDTENGSGTASDPYRISNAAEFLAMQDKINFTASANKYFVLTDDIDLSEIKASDFTSNKVYSGSLVSACKTLGATSKNVYFVLDGNGHAIKNLNVSFSKSGSFAIFGCINSRSTVKNLTVENCSISASTDVEKAAVLVAENEGTVLGCTVKSSTLSLKGAAYAGLVAATNAGTISETQVIGNQSNVNGASAAAHTISGYGIIGAVAGSSSGKVTSVTALNIGCYIEPKHTGKAVYGGIVGASSATVSNSFASGNVVGGNSTDVVGGLVGTALNGAEFKNNYILVALSCNASGNGLVGSGASSDMLGDSYWSSSISHRAFAVADDILKNNDISSLGFKAVKVGSQVSVTSSELAASWGKASIKVKGNYKGYGDAIFVSFDSSSASIKGVTAGSVGQLGYTSEISLPSTVGNGSIKLSQSFRLPVLVVSEKSKGNGTQTNPLVIGNSADFSLLKYAHGVYAQLDGNISVSSAAFTFVGSLDGSGYTVTAKAPVFSEVYGSLKNINVLVSSDISTAVFGKAIDANISGVSVSLAESAKFNATASVSGVMFNSVCGKSTLDDCRVKADVKVENANAIFGAVAGAINGNGTVIKNSGAAVSISGSVNAAKAALVIGSVGAKSVSISNCYASGTNEVGAYSFVADIEKKDVKLSSIYLSKGTQTALNFEKYSFIDKSEFIEWRLNDSNSAFFAGNGGSFELTVPSIKAMNGSSAKEYTLEYDSASITAVLTVENGKLVLGVSRKSGVVTVKGLPITITNTATGLSTVIYASNGLEKDSSGRYVISSAYDLAYISENVSELYNASFVMSSDVDMSVISSFSPIGGTLVPFSGKLDGNGHTISNLKIDGTSKVGLFASLNGAQIANLTVSSANVTAKGSYSAVLAGQVSGSTVIKNISIINSTVSSDGIYTGAVFGAIASGNSDVSDIIVSGCEVASKANYVGAFGGYAIESGVASNIKVADTSVSGAEYVAGVIGLIENGFAVKSVNVSLVEVKGVSEVSGISAGRASAIIDGATVNNSEITAMDSSAAFTAGGIASSFDSSISNASISNTTIKAGIASAVVAKTVSDGKLSVKNANIIASNIIAASVAAGVLGVHNVSGAAVMSNVFVDDGTVITSERISAGVVGDVNGSESTLVAQDVKSLACVEISDSVDAIAAAGLLGRLNTSAANNVQFENVKILGSVSGNAAVGGLIGLVKGTGKVYSDTPMISNAVCAAQLKVESTSKDYGVVLGCVENDKSFDSANVDDIFKGIVISTYFGNSPVFGENTGLTASDFVDLDKPNGASIEPSVKLLANSGETEISLSNLPKVKGYSFDAKTGWVSEAEDRILVVASSESKVTLAAKHQADISVVGYYVSDTDEDVRIPVHFNIKSDARTPLKGDGTSEKPYLISNAYDLETVAYYESLGKYFALAEDITFKAEDFEFGGGFYNIGNGAVTIGNAEKAFMGHFTGLYNGKVHSINGLELSGNTFGGLFGATDSAEISDLIINNAEVSGLSYSGAMIGNAANTVVSNITINNSSISSTQLGGVAGALIGYAKNVTAENISINGAKVSTSRFATLATVEYAGGIAGVFGGKLSNVSVKDTEVSSAAVVGGLVGSALAIKIDKFSIDACVGGRFAGGAIGSMSDSANSALSNGIICGTVKGNKAAAGVIAEVKANEARNAKSEQSLISETVVAATAEAETSAAVIGNANEQSFADDANVISNVYYSSYQNEDVFGNRELNSIGSINSAVDLSAVTCLVDGTEKSFITLDGEATVLSEDDIILAGGNGSYKSFELCGHKFELSSVSSSPVDVLKFNAANSSISANGSLSGAKLVLSYNNGLELAIPVSYSSLLVGSGTQSAPYLISTADEFAVMMQNGGTSEVYYRLMNDIDLSGVESAESFDGVLDGNGFTIYDFTGASLFASVSGTIKNLAAVGFKLSSSTKTELGALAGALDGATVENCVVIAEVNASGKVQDAGILAGRAINGAKVDGCLTSGKVTGEKLLAAGGIVGSTSNATITACVSTAYVAVGGYAGGIVGEAEHTALNNVVFANMTKSSSKTAANIAGRFAQSSKAEAAYFDSRTARSDAAVHSGDSDGMTALDTASLCESTLKGFVKTDGYALPSGLTGTEKSAKFVTTTAFAAMPVRYISGINSGTALNYTDIKVPSEVNSNAVSVDKSNELVITLMKNSDFGDCDNLIARYADPAKENSTEVSYNVTDLSGELDGKLIGVLLKSKCEGSSNSFSSFTRVGTPSAVINKINVSDGEIYAELKLPEGYTFTVKAIDEQGNELESSAAANEGVLIKADKVKAVSISFEISAADKAWGLRSIWSVIGK